MNVEALWSWIQVNTLSSKRRNESERRSWSVAVQYPFLEDLMGASDSRGRVRVCVYIFFPDLEPVFPRRIVNPPPANWAKGLNVCHCDSFKGFYVTVPLHVPLVSPRQTKSLVPFRFFSSVFLCHNLVAFSPWVATLNVHRFRRRSRSQNSFPDILSGFLFTDHFFSFQLAIVWLCKENHVHADIFAFSSILLMFILMQITIIFVSVL